MKLTPALELGGKCEIDVFDVTAGAPKKRCRITIDYTPADLEQIRSEGRTDTKAAMEYYDQRIYELVRLNISDDWEWAEGRDEVEAVIRRHIDDAFDGD